MLYSDIGKVPSDSGIFRSTGELREFAWGSNGPYEKGEGSTPAHKGRPASPLLLYIRGQGAPLDTTIDLLIS